MKKLLTLAAIISLLGIMVSPMTVMADNTADQSASTSSATSIVIRAQDYTTTVAAITFPAGAPGATISAPTNDQTQTQTFGAAGAAKPVVTLVNTADVQYTIWYTISSFTNGVVDSENYLINAYGAECANADAITGTVTFDANTTTAATIGAADGVGHGDEKDLYLKITLSSVAGKTGTSTITILGEN